MLVIVVVMVDTNDCKICYCVSDVRSLVKETLCSIRSLSRFVEKDEIIVFYTPPRTKKSYYVLSKFATVIETENITEPFKFVKDGDKGRYGEKIHVCDVDSPNAIFLDSDTLIKKNPLELLDGDYDVSGRVESELPVDVDSWLSLFRSNGKEPIPFMNTGFLIFKNGAHKEIRDEWLKYVNSDLPKIYSFFYHKDELAFALAISGKNIKWMSFREHAYRWKREHLKDTYVLHGRKRNIKEIVAGMARELLYNI